MKLVQVISRYSEAVEHSYQEALKKREVKYCCQPCHYTDSLLGLIWQCHEIQEIDAAEM